MWCFVQTFDLTPFALPAADDVTWVHSSEGRHLFSLLTGRRVELRAVPSLMRLCRGLMDLQHARVPKVLLPLGTTAAEYALCRHDLTLAVSYYTLGRSPEVLFLNRHVPLEPLMQAAMRTFAAIAPVELYPNAQASMQQWLRSDNARSWPSGDKSSHRPEHLQRYAGSTADREQGDGPVLAFDFELEIAPQGGVPAANVMRSDLHALLFAGVICARNNDGEHVIANSVPVLCAQTLLHVVEKLKRAWDDGRGCSWHMASNGTSIDVQLVDLGASSNSRVVKRFGARGTFKASQRGAVRGLQVQAPTRAGLPLPQRVPAVYSTESADAPALHEGFEELLALRDDRLSSRVHAVIRGPEGGELVLRGLTLTEFARPILRLNHELITAFLAFDPSQHHNLRVRRWRDDVQALHRRIDAHERMPVAHDQTNDRISLARPVAPVRTASGPTAPVPITEAPGGPASTASLHTGAQAGAQPSLQRWTASKDNETLASSDPPPPRYAPRWALAVDGLRADATFFSGQSVVIAGSERTLALNRRTGEVLWEQPGALGHRAVGAVLLRLQSSGALELWHAEQGKAFARAEVVLRSSNIPSVQTYHGPDAPPVAVMQEQVDRIVAFDLRNGELRWCYEARGEGPLSLCAAGRYLVVLSPTGWLHGMDISTGETLWRVSEYCHFLPEMTVTAGGELILLAKEYGARGAALFSLRMVDGALVWRKGLDALPSWGPFAANDAIVLAGSAPGSGQNLAALDGADGSLRWIVPHPSAAGGIAGHESGVLSVGSDLVVNTPEGMLAVLDLDCGALRWQALLDVDSDEDQVPRDLKPRRVRDSLLVPASRLQMRRLSDGERLDEGLSCDLVPDRVRIDEEQWVYVCEEGGGIAAYESIPQLKLVK